MKTLAPQFIALRIHRANGRGAAELTASNHHRGSGSPSGLSRTGWFSGRPGPQRYQQHAQSRRTGRPPPATSGGKLPAVRKRRDTRGEQRAEPAKPDPRTTLTPPTAPWAQAGRHNAGRNPGYSPAGPEFRRDAHMIMVTVPGLEGKALDAPSVRGAERVPPHVIIGRRSSRNSRSSSVIRRESSVAVPSRVPPSTSACRTYPAQRIGMNPQLTAHTGDLAAALPIPVTDLELHLHRASAAPRGDFRCAGMRASKITGAVHPRRASSHVGFWRGEDESESCRSGAKRSAAVSAFVAVWTRLCQACLLG